MATAFSSCRDLLSTRRPASQASKKAGSWRSIDARNYGRDAGQLEGLGKGKSGSAHLGAKE